MFLSRHLLSFSVTLVKPVIPGKGSGWEYCPSLGLSNGTGAVSHLTMLLHLSKAQFLCPQNKVNCSSVNGISKPKKKNRQNALGWGRQKRCKVVAQKCWSQGKNLPTGGEEQVQKQKERSHPTQYDYNDASWYVFSDDYSVKCFLSLILCNPHSHYYSHLT